MEAERKILVERAYAAFAGFGRPDRLFAHDDFEEGEFEEELRGIDRDGLGLAHLGIETWSPLPYFTAEALAHFAPRIIELALSGQDDREGEPFFLRFVNIFHEGPKNARCRLFRPEQKEIMAEAFAFLALHFREDLEMEGWLHEAGLGRERWRAG